MPSEHGTVSHTTSTDSTQLYKNSSSLSPSDRRKSLICLALFPYIKRKLDKTYEKCIAEGTNAMARPWLVSLLNSFPLFSLLPECVSIRLVKALKFMFMWVYPYFNASRELVFFIYQLLYLYDHTGYYTPTLHFIGLQLKRLTFEDVRQQKLKLEQQKQNRKHNLAGSGFTKWFLRQFFEVSETVVEYSKFVLPTTVFFFKFLQWWYASDYRNTVGALPIPPPPPCPSQFGTTPLPQNPLVCPLCKDKRVNATALTTSGYVFCYDCILSYISSKSVCPVTGIPSKDKHMIRLFSSSSHN